MNNIWTLWNDYTIDNKDDFISDIINCGRLAINQYNSIMKYDVLIGNHPHRIKEINYIRQVINLSNIEILQEYVITEPDGGTCIDNIVPILMEHTNNGIIYQSQGYKIRSKLNV